MVNAAVVSACRGFFGCASVVLQSGDMIHFLVCMQCRFEPHCKNLGDKENGMHRKCKRQDELSLLSQEEPKKDMAENYLGTSKCRPQNQ